MKIVTIRQRIQRISRKSALIMVAAIMAATICLVQPGKVARAACQVPDPNYGTVTTTMNVTMTATYRIWTRIMVPDTANNSYLLEVDGNQCYQVGGSASITPNTWTWIAYQGGNADSKTDLLLNASNHSFKLIGSKPNVSIDRIVLTSDLACIPSDFGDNCNTPSDTTPPTVSLTAPAEATSVSGTTTVTANAADNTGINKVEFYADSLLISSATASPYSVQWNTTTIPNGQHLLTVKAYDTAGNIGSDSYSVTVQNTDTQAPSAPSGLKTTTTTTNSVALAWSASTDNVGVVRYNVSRNNTPIAQLGNVTNYTDNSVSANTSYTYQVFAYDAAGNVSQGSNTLNVTTPNVADTQAPSVPTQITATPVSSSQINISWTMSTDNIGVTGYDVYRTQGGKTQKVATVTTTSFGDTGLRAGTQYTYTIAARDAAGNISAQSSGVNATTYSNKKRTGVIRGTMSGSVIPDGRVIINKQGNRHVYQANKKGDFYIPGLSADTYDVTFRASGHLSTTLPVTIQDDQTVTLNVTLKRR